MITALWQKWFWFPSHTEKEYNSCCRRNELCVVVEMILICFTYTEKRDKSCCRRNDHCVVVERILICFTYTEKRDKRCWKRNDHYVVAEMILICLTIKRKRDQNCRRQNEHCVLEEMILIFYTLRKKEIKIVAEEMNTVLWQKWPWFASHTEEGYEIRCRRNEHCVAADMILICFTHREKEVKVSAEEMNTIWWQKWTKMVENLSTYSLLFSNSSRLKIYNICLPL